MINGATYPIRIAGPPDLDAVGALLLASYSTSLATHYENDILRLALPFMSSVSLHCWPPAPTTLLRMNREVLLDAEVGRHHGREPERSLKAKRTSVTLQLIRSGYGEELQALCFLGAPGMPSLSAYANCTAFPR